ncbi:hypothetical protein M3Y98_00063100 [Aphelenchoides besseyi]|nr:hypothetical protein M3Y98_00063100 [Aphelenchoides besseyi]
MSKKRPVLVELVPAPSKKKRRQRAVKSKVTDLFHCSANAIRPQNRQCSLTFSTAAELRKHQRSNTSTCVPFDNDTNPFSVSQPSVSNFNNQASIDDQASVDDNDDRNSMEISEPKTDVEHATTNPTTSSLPSSSIDVAIEPTNKWEAVVDVQTTVFEITEEIETAKKKHRNYLDLTKTSRPHDFFRPRTSTGRYHCADYPTNYNRKLLVEAEKKKHKNYIDLTTTDRPQNFYRANDTTGRYHCSEFPTNTTFGDCVLSFLNQRSLRKNQDRKHNCINATDVKQHWVSTVVKVTKHPAKKIPMTTFERLEAERQAAEVEAAKVNHPKYVDVGTGKRRPNGYYVKNEITGRYHCAEHPSNLTIGNCVSWFTMACSLITHQRYGGRCKTPHDNINVRAKFPRQKMALQEQNPKFGQLRVYKHAFKQLNDLKQHVHKSPLSCAGYVSVKMIQRTDNRYYCKDNAALRGFDVSCNSSFKHSGNLCDHYRQQRCYPPEVRLEKYIAHFRQQIDESGFLDSSELLDQYMAIYKKYKQLSTADRRSSNVVNNDDIGLKLLMDNLNNQKMIDGSHSLVQKC